MARALHYSLWSEQVSKSCWNKRSFPSWTQVANGRIGMSDLNAPHQCKGPCSWVAWFYQQPGSVGCPFSDENIIIIFMSIYRRGIALKIGPLGNHFCCVKILDRTQTLCLLCLAETLPNLVWNLKNPLKNRRICFWGRSLLNSTRVLIDANLSHWFRETG